MAPIFYGITNVALQPFCYPLVHLSTAHSFILCGIATFT